jgi:DNA-3-methyladenine glycosylase
VILRRDFYDRPTLEVARDLIGKLLVHRTREGRAAGVIIEVEAYVGEDDPACHAATGPTPRNAQLYGPPGVAYVYLNYGLHHLVNAVTEPEGSPAAVLLRALAPAEGLALMRRRRGQASWRRSKPAVPDHELCRGPGNLTRALGISLSENSAPLTRPPLCIEDHRICFPQIEWTPRIGISVGADRLWRCVVSAHPSASGMARRLNSPVRARSGTPHS